MTGIHKTSPTSLKDAQNRWSVLISRLWKSPCRLIRRIGG